MKRIQLRLLILLLSSFVSNAWATDTPYQISTNTFGFGDEDIYKLSPDGQNVVYYSKSNPAGLYELYNAPLEGGASVRLSRSAEATTNSTMPWFKISPDSSHVIYNANQDANNTWELYIAPLNGGAPIQLSASNHSTDYDEFSFSPNGQLIVYRARPQGSEDSDYSIFSVPITGGTPVQLNGTIVENGGVVSYKISSNSNYVVYTARQDNALVTELYSVPISGGSKLKLNSALAIDGNVGAFDIDSGSQRVVYLAEQETAGKTEIFSVPIVGGSPGKLNGLLEPNENVGEFKISENNQIVVYTTLQNYPSDGIWEQGYAINSVSIMGGTKNRLAGPFAKDKSISSFSISANSNQIIYTVSYGEYPEPTKIFGIPILGGSTIQFPIAAPILSYQLSPDSQRIVVQTITTDNKFHLFSTRISGGAVTGLIEPVYPWAVIRSFKITPDGKNITYIAEPDTSNPVAKIQALYIMPIDGGPKTKLDSPNSLNGSVTSIEINTPSSHVVYAMNQDSATDLRLFAISIENIVSPETDEALCFPIKTLKNEIVLTCL